MRIISKFVDYYDGVQGMGIDQTIIYHRKTYNAEKLIVEEIEKMFPSLRHNRQYWLTIETGNSAQYISNSTRNYLQVSTDTMILVFCGKAYLINSTYTLNKIGCRDKLYSHKIMPLEEYVEKSAFSWRKPKKYSFNPDFHHKIGEPCFIYKIVSNTPGDKEVIFNPNLKELNFASVQDPYTAFQNLSMFIGGVLAQAHPPIITTSDEDMKVAKGFGHKYAFKKEPTKRKL